MDHRPFEDWLLDNQILTADEQRQLNSHLQVCPTCSALAEVNLALKSVKIAEPTFGFTDRFKVRLEARRQLQRRRNVVGFTFLILSVLVGLVWIAWPIIIGLVRSPVDMLSTWLASLLSLYAAMQVLAHAGFLLFGILPDFIPTYIWTLLLFFGCGWSFLWVLSLIKFSKFPQGVK
jgi:hypothetical protein